MPAPRGRRTPPRDNRPAARAVLLAGAVLAAVLGWRMRGGPDPGGDEPGHEPAVMAALARWVPQRPATRPGRALACAWAAPNTLAGLAAAATSPGQVRRVDGAIVVTSAGGVLGRVLARRGFSATTLGHVIIARLDPSPTLLAHELCHTRQAERLGPAFGPLYLVLLAIYGYRRHPLERAARSAAQRGSGRSSTPDAPDAPDAPSVPSWS